MSGRPSACSKPATCAGSRFFRSSAATTPASAAVAASHPGVCRTAAVGAPPPEAERIWANLTACKHLLLDAIKPGASTRAIYELYLEKVGELGLPPILFIGHRIGLHLHEDPSLGPTED